MLKHLHIQNYALISQLDIYFTEGFSVITGETGAGKSIILGALGLLMGDRADFHSITEGEQKCIIEGEFQFSNDEYGKRVADFCKSEDFDYEGICLLRREITASGKSRSFLNDTPVNLSVLKKLRPLLIDIHSQHENLRLEESQYQLSIVDSVAQNEAVRADYQGKYIKYKEAEEQLSKLQNKQRIESEELDYIRFQYEQLNNAKLIENEEVEIEQELDILTHAQDIAVAMAEGSSTLTAEGGVVSSLRDIRSAIKRIEKYFPKAEQLSERIDSVQIELQDISDEMHQTASNIDADPNRANMLAERLDMLNSLMQKHRVNTVAELITIRDAYAERLSSIESYDEQISELIKEVKKLHLVATEAAEGLSKSRDQVKQPIEEQIKDMLHRLAMPNATIEVRISQLDNLTETGKDSIEFMFAANKNQTVRRITEVASGGELSRLMLSVKVLIATYSMLPTLIFDEIDTGVSGEVAAQMAQMMVQMANNKLIQILTITHLPQIAAAGKHHYKVYKEDTAQRTETNIKQLSNNERIAEIAQMLSAGEISDSAIANAKELLS